MGPLIKKTTPELVWAKVIYESCDSTCWSIRSAKSEDLIYVKDELMKGVNTKGQLLVAHMQNQKLVKKPSLIRGNHSESRVINHFSWVPQGLENTQRMIWNMLNFFKEPALYAFYYAILSNDQLMEKFYKAKASHHHHHDYEGGLLEHSFEVAMSAATLSQQYQLNHNTTCICFLAGFLHDIGKVKMYYNVSGPQGICGQHEAFSFMELAQPLDALHKAAPALFEALR